MTATIDTPRLRRGTRVYNFLDGYYGRVETTGDEGDGLITIDSERDGNLHVVAIRHLRIARTRAEVKADAEAIRAAAQREAGEILWLSEPTQITVNTWTSGGVSRSGECFTYTLGHGRLGDRIYVSRWHDTHAVEVSRVEGDGRTPDFRRYGKVELQAPSIDAIGGAVMFLVRYARDHESAADAPEGFYAQADWPGDEA